MKFGQYWSFTHFLQNGRDNKHGWNKHEAPQNKSTPQTLQTDTGPRRTVPPNKPCSLWYRRKTTWHGPWLQGPHGSRWETRIKSNLTVSTSSWQGGPTAQFRMHFTGSWLWERRDIIVIIRQMWKASLRDVTCLRSHVVQIPDFFWLMPLSSGSPHDVSVCSWRSLPLPLLLHRLTSYPGDARKQGGTATPLWR